MSWPGRHAAIVQAESERFYDRRRYIMWQLDDRHFEALNPGGLVLDLNGYCLDALEEVPAGCMTSCARMPTMHVNERGVSEAERRKRDEIAKRIVAEILAEQ